MDQVRLLICDCVPETLKSALVCQTQILMAPCPAPSLQRLKAWETRRCLMDIVMWKSPPCPMQWRRLPGCECTCLIGWADFSFQLCWDRTHGEIEERRKSRPRRPARYAGSNRPGRTEFRVTDGRRERQRYCRHGRTEGNSDGFPEFSGAVIDGGVRDVAYLQKIGSRSLA